MATHPHSAIPGAVLGRPRVLPSTLTYETHILSSAGFTVLDIAEHFGVDRSTMYRQRDFATDLLHALKGGRDAFLALQADLRALEASEATAEMRRAARQAMALLDAVPAPPAPEVRAEQLPSGVGSPVADRQGAPDEPWRHDNAEGDPIPLDDPLGDWR